VTDSDPLGSLRPALWLASSADLPRTEACLDDETIAALAEGALDADSRAAALAHLVSCARCRTAVASIARALADPSVTSALRAVQGGRWRRVRRMAVIGVPVAAAAAVVLLLVRPQMSEREAVHRAPAVTATNVPEPTTPVGLVPEAAAFRWTAVPGADRYRVTLFDSRPRVVYETEVIGLVAQLPDSVTLIPGARYLWKVEARTSIDRWESSELVEFSITRNSPR
jgi:hypothetical protein